MQLHTKECRDCGELKNLEQFSKHSKMKDGHLNSCKKCRCLYANAHRQLNPDYYREYEQSRRDDPKRNSDRSLRVLEYRKYKTKAYRAKTILNNALRDGKINKLPCQICGSNKSEAHHPDYDNPLGVTWLCHKHHMEIHSAAFGGR